MFYTWSRAFHRLGDKWSELNGGSPVGTTVCRRDFSNWGRVRRIDIQSASLYWAWMGMESSKSAIDGQASFADSDGDDDGDANLQSINIKVQMILFLVSVARRTNFQVKIGYE